MRNIDKVKLSFDYCADDFSEINPLSPGFNIFTPSQSCQCPSLVRTLPFFLVADP